MKLRDLPDASIEPATALTLQADIAFARNADGVTGISHQRVGYPFHLGRTLKLPGDPRGMPTVYLQSCSGGLFEDDDLRLRIVAGNGASAHVTSAASTIVHGMQAGAARQTIELRAGEDALLEYMPDPLILFPRARLRNRVHIRLHARASAIVGEALTVHDPAGKGAAFESFESETLVHDDDGKLRVCDRFRASGVERARGMPGITGAYAAQASLFVLTTVRPAPRLVAALRVALSSIRDVYAAASALPNGAGAWIRVLAHDAIGARAALHAAWAAARTELTGQTPGRRRK